ncbi:type VI secretion system membrane subunit TssM [Curvibacter gracilis]|uniref:type VI secretion system membrane subunit TssM n=1 Tax=Curvibacter gracilis TaxID=230310 RepID=UPI0004849EA9|nr:type VI secretion system membrane subunit TssM [Curvibacter gracilis]
MKSFFAGAFRALFSRYTLAVLALVIGCLGIWLLGPLLAFGGLHPLQSLELRVTFTLLLLCWLLCLLAHGPFLLLGVISLAVLIWHAGPLLSFGAQMPLSSAWVRAGLIGSLLLVYLLHGLSRLYQALVAGDGSLLRWLQRKESKTSTPTQQEVLALDLCVQQGIEQLRRMRHPSGTGISRLYRRLFERQRHLYDLPWFLVVGPSASGKTSAVLNSGCRFPLAEQMSDAVRTLRHISPTASSQWWFSNEAVLIDTAARLCPTPSTPPNTPIPPLPSAGTDADATPQTSASPAPTQDPALWQGYLGILRKHRPRMPINGMIVTVSLESLLLASASQRTELAASLRARLAEARQDLGIRFPVYLLFTKADQLTGFAEYFGALTSEGRRQIWGTTLPWREETRPWRPLQTGRAMDDSDNAGGPSPLGQNVKLELEALRERLENGLPTRLQEEFDLQRRQRLYALPQEFKALVPMLVQFVEDLFQTSRFDATEDRAGLRGLYFSSARQDGKQVAADPSTLIRQLHLPEGSAGGTDEALPTQSGVRQADTRPDSSAQHITTHRSYFIQDVLEQVVFREGHLVRPNLTWEFRHRIIRLLGHALLLVTGLWLGVGLLLSYRNNQAYLADVDNKTEVLAEQVHRLFQKFRLDDVPGLLNQAESLANHRQLDLQAPPLSYQYGLYAAPPVVVAARQTYEHLQDQMLLPQIVRRIENALSQAVVDRDEARIFSALRVYLMLYDSNHFRADEVRAWVLADWQDHDGINTMEARTALNHHLTSLFDGQRVVHSPLRKNEALIQRARDQLDGSNTSARLYERIKSDLAAEAPPDFTLPRVVGPQAGMIFVRRSGVPLERGVPGLYTYKGYHEVLARKLPALVGKLAQEDAWVMGSPGPVRPQAAAGLVGQVSALHAAQVVSPLVEDVRRQYLSDYAQHWRDFLEDIAPVTGGTLSFDLEVLRQLAAPYSPLARLARAAVQETTLTRPLDLSSDTEKSYLDRAAEQLDKQAEQLKKNFGLRPQAKLERQLVDGQFAALREVVTGQADTASPTREAVWPASGAMAGNPTGKPALDSIAGLINELYTSLAVAETALAANTLPPGLMDPGARMRTEAARLPAPFKEILKDLATGSSDKIGKGAEGLLRAQAQNHLERLLNQLNQQVVEPCKKTIEGRYPFALPQLNDEPAQEVPIDDFNALFAADGLVDDYFKKHLAPYVDTSLRPWRYKTVATLQWPTGDSGVSSTASAPGGPAGNAPTLNGELLKLLATQGPNPEFFARVSQIRDVFFRDAGAKKMAWKLDLKIQEIDPSILELAIHVDGQAHRYVHGPIQTMPFTWPGPQGGSAAELAASPRIRPETSTLITRGPWALLKLLERGRLVGSASSGRSSVEYLFDGRRVVLDIKTGRLPNPLGSDLLHGFECPGRA